MDTQSLSSTLENNPEPPTAMNLSPVSTIPHFALVQSSDIATNLSVKPGDRHFIRWFVISAYFPLITACMGPVSNMISIAALVERWRLNASDEPVPDKAWIITLNAISLFLGCAANVSLLLNFSERLNYKVAQWISILGWCGASMLLFAVVIGAEETYFHNTTEYHRSSGFWFGVLTVILYLGCVIILSVNYYGYTRGKYSASFNLDPAQRGVMIHTLFIAIWLAVGAAMFSKLLFISFGDAMYYCVVSLLTIGLGDITPKTVPAKIVTLIYSLIGLLELGLVVSMLRQLVLSSGGPTLFWNKLEKDRSKMYNKLFKEHRNLSNEKCFELIRAIRKESKLHQKHTSFLLTIFIFLCFWLLGAVVFHYTERWDYFDSVYFCFLCLLTIGYGDFAPKTHVGRSFFVIWALSAVPLMTILISSMGDYLYTIAYGVDDIISKIIGLFPKVKPRRLSDFQQYLTSNILNRDLQNFIKQTTELDNVSSNIRSTDSILDPKNQTNLNLADELDDSDPDVLATSIAAQKSIAVKSTGNVHMEHSMKILSLLKSLMIDTVQNSKKKYTLEEWYQLVELLDREGEWEKDDKYKLFWISEKSPLKYPIQESNYILYKLFQALEERIQLLLEEDIQREVSLYSPFIEDGQHG